MLISHQIIKTGQYEWTVVFTYPDYCRSYDGKVWREWAI